MNKTINIFGGGTVAHIANHLALTAPAYGTTAKQLEKICHGRFNVYEPTVRVNMHLTKMAGGDLETNEDVKEKIDSLVKDPNTMVIFFNCALVDYEPYVVRCIGESYLDNYGNVNRNVLYNNCDKYSYRIESSKYKNIKIDAVKSDKILPSIRKDRKDIFLVGFKTTCGDTSQEMYLKGLKQLKTAHVNLCLVNDTKTHLNMIVTPEEAVYCETTDRDKCLRELVDMVYWRSHLKFTQSTVVEGKPVDWNDNRVPESLRVVVNYCINNKAYKEFNGATVGHFACKLSDTEFLTSIRRSNFNDLKDVGLVYVKSDGPDTVMAYGAKPSVGGQSQRIIFRDHPKMDCVVHFHCPMKTHGWFDDIPVRSQREIECGSHECGKNTSDGLKQFGNLKCVMLDNHGPNIVFNSSIDPQEVISFINRNFDLSKKTGGYQL